MKKLFFIISIAISAIAVSTSAGVNKHQVLFNKHYVTDTVPNRTLDTMNHNNWDTMHHNMGDTSMMRRDSSGTRTP